MPVFLAYGMRHCRRAKEDERKGLLLEGKPFVSIDDSPLRSWYPYAPSPARLSNAGTNVPSRC